MSILYFEIVYLPLDSLVNAFELFSVTFPMRTDRPDRKHAELRPVIQASWPPLSPLRGSHPLLVSPLVFPVHAFLVVRFIVSKKWETTIVILCRTLALSTTVNGSVNMSESQDLRLHYCPWYRRWWYAHNFIDNWRSTVIYYIISITSFFFPFTTFSVLRSFNHIIE